MPRVKRKIFCYETKQEYDSVYQAAKELGCNPSSFFFTIDNPNRTIFNKHYCSDLNFFDDKKLTYGDEKFKKSVFCFETKTEFNSVKEAAEWANIASSSLSVAINNPNKSSGGYHWCTDLNMFKNCKLSKVKNQKVTCYETKKEFKSPKEAMSEYDIKGGTGNITRCINDPYLTCGGFHWHTCENYKPKYSGSTYEYEIHNFLSDLNIKYKKDRTVLNGYEIDFLIGKLGIEFNGNFFHRGDHVGVNYHQDKTLLCAEKGINLIHIFEHQWKNKKHVFMSMIKNKLKLNKTIYARKCKIIELTSCSSFLNENHLQGDVNSLIKIGLQFNGELVCVMTFGEPRYNKKYQWELIRFCSKIETNVVGGASKLLSYFEKKYKPINLISYANLQWSNGDLYKKLNFTYLKTTNPSYWWIKNGLALSRYKCQKHLLSKILNNFKPELTENENMISNGYYKVFDCGNIVFEKIYK